MAAKTFVWATTKNNWKANPIFKKKYGNFSNARDVQTSNKARCSRLGVGSAVSYSYTFGGEKRARCRISWVINKRALLVVENFMTLSTDKRSQLDPIIVVLKFPSFPTRSRTAIGNGVKVLVMTGPFQSAIPSRPRYPVDDYCLRRLSRLILFGRQLTLYRKNGN